MGKYVFQTSKLETIYLCFIITHQLNKYQKSYIINAYFIFIK